MADDNVDRFLLARRLGKSMDMVGNFISSPQRFVSPSLMTFPPPRSVFPHVQLRKRIRILSRGPNLRRRRVKDKRSKTAASGSKTKGSGGGSKKRKRKAAAEDDSEESAVEIEDDEESDDGGEWQGDSIDTDNDTIKGGSNAHTVMRTQVQVMAMEGVRRSTRRRAARHAPEPTREAMETDAQVGGATIAAPDL
jgi:hypothetical protein